MKTVSSLGFKERLRLWWLQRAGNPVQEVAWQGDKAASDLGVLLRAGAIDTVAQENLLFSAAHAGHAQLVATLLDQGSDLNVNVRDPRGLAALHHAATAVSLPTLEVLLKHGAEVGLKDKLGRTAAHHAARVSAAVAALRLQGYACVDALVAAGADLASQDVYHQTVVETGGRAMGVHYGLLGSPRGPAVAP